MARLDFVGQVHRAAESAGGIAVHVAEIQCRARLHDDKTILTDVGVGVSRLVLVSRPEHFRRQ